MKKILTVALALPWLALPLRSAAQEKFRAASGGFSTAIHALLWLAYEKKLFQKYGLDGEYLALESGTPAMQALLANELQIVFTTGALAITANLQGADATIIAGGINFIPNKLLVRPDIKTPEGLKGKRIAISRFGSASDYATQVALEKLGINPKDVTIVQTGGNMTRLGGFESGHRARDLVKRTAHHRRHERIQAKLADRSGRERRGIPAELLYRKAQLLRGQPSEDRQCHESDHRELLYFAQRQSRWQLALMKKYNRVSDEDASLGYDYYLAKYGDGVMVSARPQGLEFIISQVASTNAKAKGQTPESLKLLDRQCVGRNQEERVYREI